MTSENMEIVGLLAALVSYGFLLYLAYRLVIKSEIRNLPTISDGKEQDAFRAWATTQGLDTNWHSEQQLFLNPRATAAREGWKAAIVYCRKQALQSKVAEKLSTRIAPGSRPGGVSKSQAQVMQFPQNPDY